MIVSEQLGSLHTAVDDATRALAERDAIERLWSADHRLWQDDPTEVADRLGWLDEPEAMFGRLGELTSFAREVAAAGLGSVLWCGMGGSSLFPLVLDEAFGGSGDGLDLEVLDTSHPAAVARAAARSASAATLHCFASKSGGTIETRCQLDYFWEHDGRPERFAVVTDAGSPLDALATERGFRAVFHANPEIGGRFSALSHFGLVPAALLGADLEGLLHSAAAMALACRRETDPRTNAGARLAAVLAGAAVTGRDKCTFLLPAPLASFGLWLEQLVAESTGKHGQGLLPVVGELLGPPEVYGDDRIFLAYGDHPGLEELADAGHPVIRLGSPTPTGIGGEVLRWEIATALAGMLLGINPFDQPDVEAAKAAAASALAGEQSSIPQSSVAAALAVVKPGDYVSIQAFVDPGDPVVDQLRTVRTRLRDRLRVPVTLDLGPRYLHSTGQLHKGGRPNGVFLQVVDVADGGPAIPGRSYGFATLLRAQADGDYVALAERDRRIGRVALDDLLAETD